MHSLLRKPYLYKLQEIEIHTYLLRNQSRNFAISFNLVKLFDIGDWDKLSFTSFFFGVTSFMSFSDWAAFLKGGVELSGSSPIFKEKNRWMLFSDMSQSCDVKICYKFLLCPRIILWGCTVFAQNWHFLDPLLYF